MSNTEFTLFMQWLMGDDVIRVTEVESPYWTSQDAQYKNRLYTMLDAWNYYKKEFLTI
jgi:hypothetical protein